MRWRILDVESRAANPRSRGETRPTVTHVTNDANDDRSSRVHKHVSALACARSAKKHAIADGAEAGEHRAQHRCA